MDQSPDGHTHVWIFDDPTLAATNRLGEWHTTPSHDRLHESEELHTHEDYEVHDVVHNHGVEWHHHHIHVIDPVGRRIYFGEMNHTHEDTLLD